MSLQVLLPPFVIAASAQFLPHLHLLNLVYPAIPKHPRALVVAHHLYLRLQAHLLVPLAVHQALPHHLQVAVVVHQVQAALVKAAHKAVAVVAVHVNLPLSFLVAHHHHAAPVVHAPVVVAQALVRALHQVAVAPVLQCHPLQAHHQAVVHLI